MNGGGPSEDDETQAILHTSDTGPAPRLIGVARRDQASGDVELGQIGGIEQQLEDVDLQSPAHRRPGGTLLPLYSIWPSQNYFCCGGLLLTGGSSECCAPSICVWAMILFPSGLYFIFVFPQLVQRGALALPGATLVVFLVATGLLCATCCSDPGILPRRDVIIATGSAAKLEAALGYDPLGHDVQAGGVPEKLQGRVTATAVRAKSSGRHARPIAQIVTIASLGMTITVHLSTTAWGNATMPSSLVLSLA
eukprot:CAMPEP_0172894778 /NCGR_PEP_ID=MMETSP1075-20121228/151634_1 /TAXON_ID=2916 /ORGANISM="Ceratium fusus, Strain PA161109" /LENGTH=250 /DNA_ID=CAMNT_0013749857 /DNA_START=18 /DNA_END=771 /DNA_ORIENTATION=+